MKLGDCLDPAQLEHWHSQWPKVEWMVLPMGQTGHDLRFDVFLYIVPFFSFDRRSRGEQLAQITWFDVGDDTAVLNGVEVINDWAVLSSWHLCLGVY